MYFGHATSEERLSLFQSQAIKEHLKEVGGFEGIPEYVIDPHTASSHYSSTHAYRFGSKLENWF